MSRRPGTLLDAEALTPAEVGARLAGQWPDVPPAALTEAARSLLPLVQVPPRALWQRSGQVRLTTATAWLGKPRGKRLTIDDVVLRYLAAFGPACAADVQTWSGLTRLGEVLERLSPRLTTFKSERGQALYDLPDAPRPDPDTPAPVRLVAPFDNILLSHGERTRIIGDEHRKRLFSGKNGVFPGTVLVDGFVAGTWELVGKGESTSLRVQPYVRLRGKISTRSERRESGCWAAPSTSATRSWTSLHNRSWLLIRGESCAVRTVLAAGGGCCPVDRHASWWWAWR